MSLARMTFKETDTHFNKEQSLDYSPYGGIFWSADYSEKQRDNWAGKEKDKENGLGDHGVRKYDHLIGRFNSTDQLWTNYLAWNPYHYSRNNPIFLKDVNGYIDAIPYPTSPGYDLFDVSILEIIKFVPVPVVKHAVLLTQLQADIDSRIEQRKNEVLTPSLEEVFGFTVYMEDVDVGEVGNVGDLDGKDADEVDKELTDSGWRGSESEGGYKTYKNDKDNSTITVKTDGSIVRSTKRRYNKNGSRNNKGEKLIKDDDGKFKATREQKKIHETRGNEVINSGNGG